LQSRLSAVLGRAVGPKESQAEILVELLERLEQLATERQNDERS
jgi:hypothetical protein